MFATYIIYHFFLNLSKKPGFNVWYNKHVSFVQATLGAELQVPTLDGDVKYNMPAGTQPGEIFFPLPLQAEQVRCVFITPNAVRL